MSKESQDSAIPHWFLAPHEETEVRRRCQEQANQQCEEQFQAFGRCASQHQLLFSWKCADLKEKMVKCVEYWGSNEKYEEIRDRFIIEKAEILKSEGKR